MTAAAEDELPEIDESSVGALSQEVCCVCGRVLGHMASDACMIVCIDLHNCDLGVSRIIPVDANNTTN